MVDRDAPDRIWLDEVFHQALIDVDETGTTAAAATVGIALGSPKPPPFFVFDRPFLFVIRHEPTGTILFLGRVVNPKA